MKKYILFPMLIALTGFLVSCADKLYSDPADRITDKQIIELSKSDPDKVLTPMANSIQVYPSNAISSTVWCRNLRVLLIGMDYKGNDMVLLLRGNWFDKDYRMENYRTPLDELPPVWWNSMYSWVYKANQFLDLIPDLESVTNPDVLKKLQAYKAIGLTFRAWTYSTLMWLYQDGDRGVPMYLKANIPVAGRTPSAEVWAQIIADAKEAVRLFNESGRNPLANIDDMDAMVANMVLARAALTTGDWNTVITATEAVIATYPTLMNETDYTTKGFGWVDVDEIIYGFGSDKTIGGTSSFHGWMNILGDGGYGGSQNHWNAIDSRLYQKINDNDYRKTIFLDAPMQHTYAGAAEPVEFPKYASMKFAAPAHTGQANYVQGEIFMRTSEAILMKAEAQVRSGQEAAAKTTLNTLLAARTKAGETPLTCDNYSSDNLSVLEMVQLQTRIELWGEGFEFNNNKRWNIPVDRENPASENHTAKITRPVKPDMTLQIPLSETQYNQYIVLPRDQNP